MFIICISYNVTCFNDVLNLRNQGVKSSSEEQGFYDSLNLRNQGVDLGVHLRDNIVPLFA